VKKLSIGLKLLLFVTPILLLGDIVFTVFALRYSREYLVREMQQTLVSFSQAVALDIARGYDVGNTRSLYSLLIELRQFDSRIVNLSVIDTNGVVTADLDIARLMSRDTTEGVRSALQRGVRYVAFDETTRHGTTIVPIKAIPSTVTAGAFRAVFTIGQLYMVIQSLQQVIIFISAVVFLALSAALLLLTRTIIVAPLRRFLPTLDKIAHGDFTVPVPVSSGDEIGVLAQHVNQMALGLKEREYVRDAFSRYVPKEVVDRLLERKIQLKLEGDLETVTILFCDIRGFTHMTERLGARQVVHILNRYFTAMTDVAIEYDGIVDKFSGDEIMIVFGAPIRHEDDPPRAVRMALAMQRRLDLLNEEFRAEGLEELEIGVGIATGLAIVGNIGSEKRLNYSVIGDVVNLASRLVSQAKPGEILVSEATYDLVKEQFVCSTLGKILVKGKSEPVEIFLITSEI
jgi:class 3 adenylate cyclase